MRRKTIKEMHKLASRQDGKCLSKKYINAHYPLLWICKLGHQWKARPNNIQQGQWCPVCAHKKINEHNRTVDQSLLYKLAKENGGKCLSGEYVNPYDRLLWKCADGHQWEASYGNIQQGHWCPYCSGSYNEELCRFVFEKVLNKKFPKSRTALSNGLELDGYNCDLKLAFEYQGKQHFEYVKHWHKNHTALEQQQDRDKLKRLLCKHKGIRLIVIPYSIGSDKESIYQYICTSICSYKIPLVNAEVDFTQFRSFASRLNKLQELAKERGGKCLSTYYGGTCNKLKWQCKKDHIWEASPTSVSNLGTWCPECAGLKKMTIEDMQIVAEIRGGKCLSKKYINNKTKLKWKCRKGHIWFAAPGSVKNSKKWCPKCGRVKAWHTRRLRGYKNSH